MIRSYQDFREYLSADLEMRPGKGFFSVLKDPISRFHCYLRCVEYLKAQKAMLPLYLLMKIIFLRSSKSLGFSIPENTLGKGVYLPHWGTIVVNSKAKVGERCTLNVDVVIGRHPASKQDVPTLARGVYVAPGVKIFGKVLIGDNSVLAANSVVNKDVAPKTIVAGIPAKEIGTVTRDTMKSFGIEYFDS